jgi:PAS domain S-box-containing protein
MNDQWHSLLKRQLKKAYGSPEKVPEELKDFLALVNQAYIQSDQERLLIERSFEISSRELKERNDAAQKEIIAEQQLRKYQEIEKKNVELANEINKNLLITKALKHEKNRFDLAKHSAHIGIWEMDLVSYSLIWDDQMCALYGIKPAAFSGTIDTWRRGVHPEDLPRVLDEVQKAYMREKNFDTEFRIVWPDKTVHYLKAHGSVERDVSGKRVKIVGVSWDITKQKRIQKYLNDQQNALDQSCSVSITDAKGLIIYANQKFAENSKYSINEVLGQDHRILNSGYHPKDFMGHLWETIAGGGVWKGEIKNKAKDGSFYWVDTTIVPFLDDEGKPVQYISIRWNITTRKLAEEKALEATRVKSSFLANMSHEIRTPMNAILGFSDLLNQTELTSRQKGYLDLIANSGELLIGIINDILDISKLESGKIKFESIDCHLSKIISDVMSMLVTRLKDKTFDTYVDIKSDVPAFVMTDPLRLKQVIVNLVGNSIKFTPRGEIGVIVEKLKESTDDLELKFTVKDTGIGISKDKQERMFQAFSQADESMARRYGGTGLGLAISKAIVEGMGGQIWLESEEGRGTRFYFTLQVRKSENKQEDDQVLKGAEYFKSKTVFIVDDNRISQKVIEQCCEVMNFEIIGVGISPQEALHKLDRMIETKGVVPDIILCDIIMDGMSVFEMVRKIKANERFKETRFISITADSNAGDGFDSDRPLFNASITKPFSFETLIDAFQRLTKGSAADKAETEKGTCTGIRVLVAEDAIPNQMLVEEYLKRLGCTFDIVNNGQEAVDKLRAGHEFDLCLIDLQMPVLGGVDAVKIIRKDISKDFPVIALSAEVFKEEQQEAMDAGMSDYLMKPINFDKLKEKILQYGRTRK